MLRRRYNCTTTREDGDVHKGAASEDTHNSSFLAVLCAHGFTCVSTDSTPAVSCRGAAPITDHCTKNKCHGHHRPLQMQRARRVFALMQLQTMCGCEFCIARECSCGFRLGLEGSSQLTQSQCTTGTVPRRLEASLALTPLSHWPTASASAPLPPPWPGPPSLAWAPAPHCNPRYRDGFFSSTIIIPNPPLAPPQCPSPGTPGMHHPAASRYHGHGQSPQVHPPETGCGSPLWLSPADNSTCPPRRGQERKPAAQTPLHIHWSCGGCFGLGVQSTSKETSGYYQREG